MLISSNKMPAKASSSLSVMPWKVFDIFSLSRTYKQRGEPHTIRNGHASCHVSGIGAGLVGIILQNWN
jgi:hypothetical protein